MKKKEVEVLSKLLRTSGFSNILGALLLLMGWFSIGIIMWQELRRGNLTGLVLNPGWTPVNIVVLISILHVLFGLVGIYLKQADKTGVWGLLGFILCFVGLVWYACIQYYETFLWPLIAAQAPTLFPAVGFSPTNKFISGAFLLSGLFWGLGYIVFGVTTTRSGFFPKWASIAFAIGALVFGLGMIPLIRTLGVLLFAIGMIRMGIVLLRE